MAIITELYNEAILQAAQEQRNANELENANVRGRLYNRKCGDLVEFAAQVTENSSKETVANAVSFANSSACLLSETGASNVTDYLMQEDVTVAGFLQLSEEEILAISSQGIAEAPAGRDDCLTLAGRAAKLSFRAAGLDPAESTPPPIAYTELPKAA